MSRSSIDNSSAHWRHLVARSSSGLSPELQSLLAAGLGSHYSAVREVLYKRGRLVSRIRCPMIVLCIETAKRYQTWQIYFPLPWLVLPLLLFYVTFLGCRGNIFKNNCCKGIFQLVCGVNQNRIMQARNRAVNWDPGPWHHDTATPVRTPTQHKLGAFEYWKWSVFVGTVG